MDKKKIIILQSLLAISSHAFFNDFAGIDEQGYLGFEKTARLVPSSDAIKGGTSEVLGFSGVAIEPCFEVDGPFTEKFDISGALVQYENTLSHFHSKLKVTDYVSTSNDSLGWASSGWWFIPWYDSTAEGESVFDKAKFTNLYESSWLSISLSYSKGDTLTIQLKGEGIDENDSLQSPPRISYVGVGYFEQISLPMKAFRRDTWSVPKDYDASKVSAIGFFRLENALVKGAEFPSSKLVETELKIQCVGSGSSQGDGACHILPVKTSSEGINLIGKEVHVYSTLGEKVWSGLWTGSLSSLSKGLYFVKWQNQVLKFNHD